MGRNTGRYRKASRWIHFGIALFIGALLTLPAHGSELYVALTGSDANPGTINRPFRTISRAANAAAPGSHINVRGGRYFEVVKINSSGSPNRPILVQPYKDEKVTIDGSQSAADTDLIQISANYIIFRRFEVANATRTGICAWGTHGVQILDNTIVGSQRGAIWVGHATAGRSGKNIIEGNVAHTNATINQSRVQTKEWPIAIAVAVSDQSIVQGNTVYQNFGEGIGVLSSHGVVVQSNRVFDNYSVMIYLDNAPETVVKRNVVYSNGDPRFFRDGRPANGILVANEYTSIPLPSKNIRIEGNELTDVGGISYGSYEGGGGLQDCVIKDNVIVVTASPIRLP